MTGSSGVIGVGLILNFDECVALVKKISPAKLYYLKEEIKQEVLEDGVETKKENIRGNNSDTSDINDDYEEVYYSLKYRMLFLYKLANTIETHIKSKCENLVVLETTFDDEDDDSKEQIAIVYNNKNINLSHSNYKKFILNLQKTFDEKEIIEKEIMEKCFAKLEKSFQPKLSKLVKAKMLELNFSETKFFGQIGIVEYK
jgi:hypothetical protein